MNRRLFNILMIGAVAVFSLSCNQENIAPDVPDTPAEGKLVRLTFGTADAPGTRAVWKDETGKGNLIFNWDSHPDSPAMMAVISNGYDFIPNVPSSNNLSEPQYHTGLTVTPQEDPYYATFKTERYYFENIISTDAKKIFVTSGYNNDTTSDPFFFRTLMQMPNLFTQQSSQQPDFLREWMMLYGEAEMKNGSALIPLKHIPADCGLANGSISINFTGVKRTYSRLRIAAEAGQELTVATTGFTPAGATSEVTDDYTLTTDDKGNAFLYGLFAEKATVSVKQGETAPVNHTFTSATEKCVSYALDAKPAVSSNEETDKTAE